jgi:hypothetical protein
LSIQLSDLIHLASNLFRPPASTTPKAERQILIVPLHGRINQQQGDTPVVLARAAEQLARSGLLWKWIGIDGKPRLVYWDSKQKIFIRGTLDDWVYYFGDHWRVRDTNNVEYRGPSPVVTDRLIAAVLSHPELPTACFALQLQRKREAR